MADYFVSASGSNTAPYNDWAKAATSLQTALTAASSGGDRVIIQHNGVPSTDAELAADATYTASADVTVIAASNDGGSAFTPTPMGASNWIGNSTTFRSITISGGFVIAFIGVTFLVSGTTVDHFVSATTDNQLFILKNSRIDILNTAAGSRVRLGISGTASINSAWILEDCTLRFGNVGQGIEVGGNGAMVNCTISGAGSAPSELFQFSSLEQGGYYEFHGCDFSPATGTLFGSSSAGARRFKLYACSLGAGVVVLAAQAVNNQSSIQVELLDCAAGDVHYQIGFHNALGSLVADTGIYANDGAQYDGTNRCSWKIVTTSLASRQNPFQTPWISKYHAGTAAITPSFEVLRDGSASAYTDAQVWGEWSAKLTSGSVRASVVSDRVEVGATAAAQASGVGLAGWAGKSATAWSGKLAPESSITPAEIGDICARVCVGVPSATVYVDPTIRGA